MSALDTTFLELEQLVPVRPTLVASPDARLWPPS